MNTIARELEKARQNLIDLTLRNRLLNYRTLEQRMVEPEPRPPLVPGLRAGRAAARPLQPHPHPRALRLGGAPSLLRGHRRPVPEGGARLGQGTLCRCNEGRGECVAGFRRVTLRH